MDRVSGLVISGKSEHNRHSETEPRVLRSKLLSLTLDWELAALTLDAQRYKSHSGLDGESLRESATVYRKCIAEVTDLLGKGSVGKAQTA